MDTIYIVEDDLKLSSIVKEFLEEKNYRVFLAENFTNIISEVEEIKPSIILLDINLPYFDGYYICREIRRVLNTPIIIISARNGETDQVLALDLGADDYIVKPFKLEILSSKIKALLRRSFGEYAKKTEYNIQGLKLDIYNYKLTFKGKSLEISKNEMKILKKFFEYKGEVITRNTFFEELWDDVSFVDENTLTVNITRIKNILRSLGLNNVVKTKRGVGYVLDIKAIY